MMHWFARTIIFNCNSFYLLITSEFITKVLLSKRSNLSFEIIFFLGFQTISTILGFLNTNRIVWKQSRWQNSSLFAIRHTATLRHLCSFYGRTSFPLCKRLRIWLNKLLDITMLPCMNITFLNSIRNSFQFWIRHQLSISFFCSTRHGS